MIRAGTLSLALVAGLFFMQGCSETPVSANEEFVETDSPIVRASSENRQDRDQGEGDDFSLYVSSGGTNQVLAYDGETGAFERKFAHHGGLIEPEGIAFGPDGNLYVSSRSDEVLRYDGKTGKFSDVFASGHGLVDPAGIAFGGPDNDLFVSSGLAEDGGGGNQILRFDGATGAFEAVVDPANAAGLDDPEALAFGPDGLLYVASTPEEGPGEVIRYNPANNSFVDKFIPKANSDILDPTGLVFGPDGDLFLSSAATSEVKRYDGKTGLLKSVFITAGLGGLNEAEGMAFGPNGNLFVASELGNAVLEYNGTTGAFVRQFVAAGSGGLSEPTFITFGPAAGGGEGAPTVDRLAAAVLPPGNPTGLTGVWLRVRLTDADDPGPWDWRIDWGEGPPTTLADLKRSGEFAFLRSTPYTTPGPHTITVTVTDPGGLRSAPATTTVP